MTKDLKVVLINVKGDTDAYWGYYPPLGILSIASFALHNQLVTKEDILILDANFPYLIDRIKAIRPDIIGFSCYSLHFDKTLSLAKILRRVSDALFVIGGPHISLDPTSIVLPFELGVIGEGELVFANILKTFNRDSFNKNRVKIFQRVPGVIALDNKGKKIISKPELNIFPLDKIPPLEWSLLPEIYFRSETVKVKGIWKTFKVMPLFTSRGCPYNCVFCARHYIGRTIRYFSPEHVAAEIKNLVEKHNVQAIHIWDDLFVISKKRIDMIADALEKEHLLGQIYFFRVFARSDLIRREGMIESLINLNVLSLSFGFESGSQKILSFLKNDTTNVKDNLTAINLCQKHKLGIVANMVVGSPNETISDLNKTLTFCQLLAKSPNTEVMEVNRLTPVPGTVLWKLSKKQGLLPKDEGWKKTSFIDASNEQPFYIKDEKVLPYYKTTWDKLKELERKVYLNRNKQKNWLSSYVLMQKTNKKKGKYIIWDYLKKDIINHRWRVGLYTLKSIILNKLLYGKLYRSMAAQNQA